MGHCNTKKKQKRKRVKSNKRKRRRTQKGGGILSFLTGQQASTEAPAKNTSWFSSFFGSTSSSKADVKASPQADVKASPADLPQSNVETPATPTVDGIIALINTQPSDNKKIIEDIKQIKTLETEDIEKLKQAINANVSLLGEIKKNDELAKKLGIDATSSGTSEAKDSGASSASGEKGSKIQGPPGSTPGLPAGPPQGGKGSRKKKKKSRKKK